MQWLIESKYTFSQNMQERHSNGDVSGIKIFDECRLTQIPFSNVGTKRNKINGMKIT